MVGQVGSSLVAAAVAVERAKPAVVVVGLAKPAAVAAAVVGLAKPVAVAVAAVAAVAALPAEDFEFLLEQV